MKFTIARKTNNHLVPMYGVRNITIDVCKYLNGGSKSNFLSMLLNMTGESANCLHPCPIHVSFRFVFILSTDRILFIINFRDYVS